MARLGNKKSRRGCIRCKTRKVKCDEVRPACGWCVSHAIDCEYPDTTTRPTREPSVTSSTSPTPAGSLQNTSTSSMTGDARLELGLFQYYVYTVARTFPVADKERGIELHANLIPQASLNCPNLLDSMYSFALLHMHVQSVVYGLVPRNADFFREAGLEFPQQDRQYTHTGKDVLSLHMTYLDRALQGQRDVVSKLDPKNADGICISAVLLAQMALIHSSQAKAGEAYSIPSDWFILQAAFSTCLDVSRPMLRMDSATSMMIHSLPAIDNRNLDDRPLGRFRHLLEWRPEGAEQMGYRSKETYRHCVAYVETIHNRIAEQEPWQSLGRRILAFPSVGAARFQALLEDLQPRALAILAHLLAMTKRLDDSWWVFQGVADHHVRGIATIVSSEWQWAMQWPMRVVDSGAADDCFQSGRSPNTIDSSDTPSNERA